MENIRSQDSRQRQRERQTQNARHRRQRMSVKQRQEELARRRSNYRQNKDKGKQVQTCDLSDMRTMIPFQDLTNANFASRFYQRAHDNEVGPSTIYVSRVPSTDQNFTYPIFQQNDNHETRPFIRNIDDNDCESHSQNINSPVETHETQTVFDQGTIIYIFQARHNIARNFRNTVMTIKSLLPTSSECRRCNAKLFHRESQDMCCKGGKVTISQVPAPDELLQLFLDSSTEGRHFRQHIRSYNHVMSFTSLGVHVDESLVATGHGIYTFRLALEPNIEECRLLIKERPSNQPQYSLPSASQVAAIVIGGGDEDTIERGRDINVINCDGKLTKIRRNDQSVLLKSGRLLQQYVIDNYVKIETERLRWIRRNQNNIRSEVYQGLQDALHDGENNADNVGQRTILPPSFIGSKRDMT
ncbi:uncharacterized protein LOC127102791 [Lathyrus oleraceus]|uniref:uncharacterized protein LOC127102791 n=1 Tax=Pisum sativum TaxID=3888 RepID=UPI0021D24A1B|nr:uncharacterized protein LOC127102791 [Pisum sativum]